MASSFRGSVFLEDPEDPPKVKIDTCTCLKDNLLLILTIVGIVLGFIIGFAIRPLEPSEDALMWLGMTGEIFLRLLKMMIIPLVVSCIISGSASLDPKCNGKISMVTLAYVMVSNALCALIGIILAVSIRPGQLGEASGRAEEFSPKTKTQDIFADLIRNFIPDNLIGACIRQVHTSYVQRDVKGLLNGTLADNSTDLVNETLQEDIRNIGYTDGANLLGLVFASLVFGIATCMSGEAARPFYEFFSATGDIILKIFGWFLWFSPIGIASLTAAAIAGVENPSEAFLKLGYFSLTVSSGVVFHQIVLLPAISFIVWRKNPYLLFLYQIKGWLTVFATTSGIVCIPYFTSGCERYGVEKMVARFVIPFSLTISRNGSAIYVAISTLFVAQHNDIALDVGTIIVIWLMTSFLIVALPDIPSGSIVILMIILQSTGLPINDIATLFTVEWILDRIRASSNGMSHCFCAVFVYALCKNDFELASRGTRSREEIHHQKEVASANQKEEEQALNVDPVEPLESDDEEELRI
ncbi:excitatory amino acid transporter-like [Lineus longissimus]|uniref:excitatory amino acid transporter-like n=1 Tax=Lineus longissimus TaxID=88925 RepID=UPI002B4D68C0